MFNEQPDNHSANMRKQQQTKKKVDNASLEYSNGSFFFCPLRPGLAVREAWTAKSGLSFLICFAFGLAVREAWTAVSPGPAAREARTAIGVPWPSLA